MEYLGAWGTLIHEKKLRSKISCQTPFKDLQSWSDKIFSLTKGSVFSNSNLLSKCIRTVFWFCNIFVRICSTVPLMNWMIQNYHHVSVSLLPRPLAPQWVDWCLLLMFKLRLQNHRISKKLSVLNEDGVYSYLELKITIKKSSKWKVYTNSFTINFKDYDPWLFT